MPDHIPGKLAVLYRDTGLVTEPSKNVLQTMAPVWVSLPSKPQRVRVVVHRIIPALFDPSPESVSSLLSQTDDPVISILR
jgi:hypothetical protein